MTAPEPEARRPFALDYRVGLFLRVVVVAACVAMLVAGVLCLDHLTGDRVATGIIAGAVALLCLVVV